MVKETLDAPYSHYLLDADLSQKIDRRTIEEMEIDGFTLMEIAGSSAAKTILQKNNFNSGIFLCGKGNNAGDALVLARYLIQHDIDVTVIFLSGSNDLSPDAQKNLTLLKKFNHKNHLTFFDSWAQFNSPNQFDFIIDGLLGTGLTSDVRGDYINAVEWANKQDQPVISMDIPTGIHADSGKIMGTAITATSTFTFGGRKLGLYLEDGPEKAGTIHYCELPFPNKFKEDCNTYLLDDNWVKTESPTPGPHKYNSGVLYIIAGSEGLTGAAIMAAQSAWAEGLGAVILICPKGILPIYEQTLPPIIKKPVGSRDDFFFKEAHANQVLEILSEKEGALLLGPGLGREQSTVTFVHKVLSQKTSPTVIDADGLWCLAQLDEIPKPERSEWILTPHPGELNRLTQNAESQNEYRLQTVREYAQTTGTTILAKGMPGIIGTPTGKCYLTNYNTTYFARAGSGDVLAGKVSAWLALGYGPTTSCAQGLLNGKQKLEKYLAEHQDLPEPSDFI
ncbi:NAD(P)H-hydrate dehydratase [Fodinibius sp. SL11]|uniref:NAD(P)H-hydrate dehydratase n=1 Tax=Fodinibius sp. SL11 TaxID=3425690 RepID=UPI003F880BFC